jgi:hypothetical protein
VETKTEQFVDYVSFLTEEDDSNGKAKRGKVLKNAQVSMTSEPVETPSTAQKPHLTVYRNKGVVESIEIFCLCGHQVKIDLVYTESAKE